MRLRVVTPERAVFDGAARSLVAPAWDGWVGVLPGHAPLLTLMGEGPLTVKPESGGEREFEIGGGRDEGGIQRGDGAGGPDSPEGG